jgi:DNA-binding NarL/FixJ family response regulator
MDRILIADDHPLVRSGIRALLSSSFPDCEIREAPSLKTAMQLLSTDAEYDLVMLDLDLPDAKQLEAFHQLRSLFPSLPIAILSGSHDAALARSALMAGAVAFISKSERPDVLISAIESIREGGTYTSAISRSIEPEEERILRSFGTLTPQQRAVMRMIVEGRLNKQIAHELDISLTTVKAHVSAILSKLEVVSRTQAALLAKRWHLFP